MKAAQYGHTAVEALLGAGADPDMHEEVRLLYILHHHRIPF